MPKESRDSISPAVDLDTSKASLVSRASSSSELLHKCSEIAGRSLSNGTKSELSNALAPSRGATVDGYSTWGNARGERATHKCSRRLTTRMVELHEAGNISTARTPFFPTLESFRQG